MRLGPSGRDELVAPRLREREIGQAVAVNVAELDAAEPELDSTEAVGMARHAIPGGNRFVDPAAGGHVGFNPVRVRCLPRRAAGPPRLGTSLP